MWSIIENAQEFSVSASFLQRLPGVDGQGLHEDSVDTWHVSWVVHILLCSNSPAMAFYVCKATIWGNDLAVPFLEALDACFRLRL